MWKSEYCSKNMIAGYAFYLLHTHVEDIFTVKGTSRIPETISWIMLFSSIKELRLV